MRKFTIFGYTLEQIPLEMPKKEEQKFTSSSQANPLYLEKAKKLFGKVKDNIKFNKEGLIEEYDKIRKKESISSSENILFAICEPFFGTKNFADNLVSKIKGRAGFDGNLIKGDSKNISFTQDNVLLALYEFLSGNKSEAKKIITEIEERIGYNKEGLVLPSTSYLDRICWTAENAIFSVNKALFRKNEKAIDIVSAIEQYIGYDENGLIRLHNGGDNKLRYTHSNAWLAIAKYCLGG